MLQGILGEETGTFGLRCTSEVFFEWCYFMVRCANGNILKDVKVSMCVEISGVVPIQNYLI